MIANALFTFIAFSMLCCLNEYFPCHLLSVAHITHTRLVKIDRALSACLPMLRIRPSGIEFTIKKSSIIHRHRVCENRTLFGYSACSFALSVLVIYLIPTKVPIRISTPIINGTTGFLTKPAMMYVRHDMPATSTAYGSCVDT